jgi:membrane protein DedA with SNARE-associated domain
VADSAGTADRSTTANRFFARWGVASVFLAASSAPVRAVIPLVAGMMDMPQFKIPRSPIGRLGGAVGALLAGRRPVRRAAVSRYLLDKVPWWAALAIVAAAALVAYTCRGCASQHQRSAAQGADTNASSRAHSPRYRRVRSFSRQIRPSPRPVP